MNIFSTIHVEAAPSQVVSGFVKDMFATIFVEATPSQVVLTRFNGFLSSRFFFMIFDASSYAFGNSCFRTAKEGKQYCDRSRLKACLAWEGPRIA